MASALIALISFSTSASMPARTHACRVSSSCSVPSFRASSKVSTDSIECSP
jgi:hypothetical protein